MVKQVNAEVAILDGELAFTDHLGHTVFAHMMQRRHLARYFAFDLMWLNAEDLTQLPLLTRKKKLKRQPMFCTLTIPVASDGALSSCLSVGS